MIPSTDSPETNELSERSVAQGLVIDFDRTLGDVEAAMGRFHAAAAAIGMEQAVKDAVDYARAHTETGGGAFEPLTILKNELVAAAGRAAERGESFSAGQKYSEFAAHFIANDATPVLYEDGARFLERLNAARAAYSVMTYGVSPEWQQLKVAASHYQGHLTVIDHKDKGSEIGQMRRHDGKFAFGDGRGLGTVTTADSMCLIDDKAVAFNNLPPDCSGYLLQRSDDAMESQKGEIPAGVMLISSLDELEYAEQPDGSHLITKKTA